ncbi:MAG: DNA translocase FtsK [Clostridia bacterium]|nr:DNA translocase FtsK [Clostridia bacterium]
MRNDKEKKDKKISYIFTRETFGMTLLLFCAIVLLMLLTGSAVFAGIGKEICTFLYGTFGYGSFFVIALLAYLGVWLVFEKKLKLKLKKSITISFTVFVLFLLFHAATTHTYSLDNYGTYIADSYMNAQNGFVGYTFGGVVSAIFVWPVAKLGGFVTAYVVFSVLALLFGYLVFLAFKRDGGFAFRKEKEERAVELEAGQDIAAQQQNKTVSAVKAEVNKEVPVMRRVEERHSLPPENDKYSQKNLGRKILFEKGEFAAESYRRNMIFNENSYFANQTTSSEADYLSSFSTSPKPAASQSAVQKQKTYTESYQEEVFNQPTNISPSNYVYGEKPIENLNEAYSGLKDDYPAYSEGESSPYEVEDISSFNDFSFNEEEKEEQQISHDINEEQISVSEEPSVIQSPREHKNVGFTDNTSVDFSSQDKSDEQSYREIINSEPENNNSSFGFLNTDSIRGDRQTRTERSNSELFDDNDDDLSSEKTLFVRSRNTEQPLQSMDLRAGLRRQEVEKPTERQPKEEKAEEKPKHVWKKYVRPTLDLLDNYPENANVNTAEIEDNKRIIVETLERFKITSEVSNVTIGPSITRYDVIIEDRTKITQALKYKEAVAMELRKDNVTAYLNYSKGALSIEVPNNQRAIVGLKTMLASQKFINSKQGALTFALGKNVEGEVVCPDITKMPHLLVAGTTGSGKSICLSALLVSLLYKYGPEELRLILVDPKQVEFISYDKLPHLMINEILYECDKAIKALNWAIKEMERRYTLFKDMTESGVATKNLDEYNAHLPQGEEKLPKIVIVLDEFGDLMLQAKKDIESRIIKLVQKARACGIHLILATQRPSVDCITGLIKSNLPTRIGFKVNSFDDARTIFDIGGAEKLLGKGDSYFRSAENPDLSRIQCCFVDTHEVQKVTDFVKANNETYFDESVSDFINKVEQEDVPQAMIGSAGDGEENETKIDDTFIKALKYCVTSNQASVSMIQRRFPVGYIKACKIIDWMENMTYVTPSEGSKPRKVLLSKEEFFNIYGDIDD